MSSAKQLILTKVNSAPVNQSLPIPSPHCLWQTPIFSVTVNISNHVLNYRFYLGKVKSTDQETIADENKLHPQFPKEEGTLQGCHTGSTNIRQEGECEQEPLLFACKGAG